MSEETQSQNIVVQQLRPLVPLWITLILGVVLGILWGYMVEPVVWTDAGPAHLENSYKKQWIKLVASQLDRTGDSAEAARQIAYIGTKDVDTLFDELSADASIGASIVRLRDIYNQEDVQAKATEAQKAVKGGSALPIGLFVVVIVIIILWGIIGGFGSMIWVIVRNVVPLIFSRGKGSGAGGPSAASRMGGIRAAQEMAAEHSTDFSMAEMGPPIVQYMSTYLIGDDLYDDSFSVETPSGDFLGETGAGISETIGVGEPKKVTAFEVWLFDKNDIKTVTKVAMSEYAYNDEALRSRLAPKGEAIALEPGTIIMLETHTLRVQARVVDLAYGNEGPFPNSYFERLTFELAAWPIEGVVIDGPPPVPPLPEAFSDDTMAF